MRWGLVLTLLALAFAQASHAEGSYTSRQLLQRQRGGGGGDSGGGGGGGRRCPGSPGCPGQGGGFGGGGGNTVNLGGGGGGVPGGSGASNGFGGFSNGGSQAGSAGFSGAAAVPPPPRVNRPNNPFGGNNNAGASGGGSTSGGLFGNQGTNVAGGVGGQTNAGAQAPVRSVFPPRGNQGSGNAGNTQGGQGGATLGGNIGGSAVVDTTPRDTRDNTGSGIRGGIRGGGNAGSGAGNVGAGAGVDAGVGAGVIGNGGGSGGNIGAGAGAGAVVNIPENQAPVPVCQGGSTINRRGCAPVRDSADNGRVKQIDTNPTSVVEDILSGGDDRNGGRGSNGVNNNDDRRWLDVADAFSRPSTDGERGWRNRASALVTAGVRDLSRSVRTLSQALLFAASPRDARLRTNRLRELSYVQSFAFASARSYGRSRVIIVQEQLGYSWANSCYDNYNGVGDYMHWCYNSGGRYNTRNDLIGAHIYGCRQAYQTRVWSPYSRSFALAISLGGYNSYPYYYDVFTQIIIIGGNSRLGLIIVISQSVCDDDFYGDPYFGVLGYGLRTRRRETCEFYGSLRSDIRGRCGSRRRFSSLPIGIRSGFTTCGYNGW